jgi:hypothetical protein
MLGVVAGQGPYPIRTQEFVLIEHAGEDPAQPVRVHQRSDAALRHTEMTRSSRMNTVEECWHPSQALRKGRHEMRHPFPLPRLDDGGGTEGQQAYRLNNMGHS